MSALLCDICGGKLKMINDGIAICESCGMEHSLERVREKYRDVQKVVHVDNAHLISNYFSMARNAYEAGNKEETEKYCNKIIEIDPSDAGALLLKGKAVGWQSAIDALRFKEAAVCFANAVTNCATIAERENMHLTVQNEFKMLATALIKLRCDRFQKCPDENEACGFKGDLDEISEAITMYVEQTGEKVNKNYIFSNTAPMVRLCMAIVSVNILLIYRANGGKNAYFELTRRTDNCVAIMQQTIDLCDDDNESDVQLYEQIAEMIDTLIKLNRTDAVQNRWGAYIDIPRLAPEEESRRRSKIQDCRSKIQKLKH